MTDKIRTCPISGIPCPDNCAWKLPEACAIAILAGTAVEARNGDGITEHIKSSIEGVGDQLDSANVMLSDIKDSILAVAENIG